MSLDKLPSVEEIQAAREPALVNRAPEVISLLQEFAEKAQKLGFTGGFGLNQILGDQYETVSSDIARSWPELQEIRARISYWLVIPPEGYRQPLPHWKVVRKWSVDHRTNTDLYALDTHHEEERSRIISQLPGLEKLDPVKLRENLLRVLLNAKPPA